MISSQRDWPLDHEAGRMYECTDSDMTAGTGPPLTLWELPASKSSARLKRLQK
jgi:hypothetical protein